MESSIYLRGDCSDGRYNDLHSHWSTDHIVSLPGVVPVLASRGKRLNQLLQIDDLWMTVLEAQHVLIVSFAAMVKFKGLKQIRLYNHQDCKVNEILHGGEPTEDILQAETDRAVAVLKHHLPHICIKGHVARHDGQGGWTIDAPVAVAR